MVNLLKDILYDAAFSEKEIDDDLIERLVDTFPVEEFEDTFHVFDV